MRMAACNGDGGWIEIAPGVRVHRSVADPDDGVEDIIRDLERRAAQRGPVTAAEVAAVIAAAGLLALALWSALRMILS